MLVTTHTIVATTIAYKTKNPYIYVPAAVLNHFVLDALPHFGGGFANNNRNLKIAAVCDAILGVGFFIFFVLRLNFPPLSLFLLDLLAGWPDLILIYRRILNGKRFARIQNFHNLIQKFESPFGIVFELAIWIACLFLIFV